MIQIQEYGLQLNEYEKNGGKEISIQQHKHLLDYYIEALYLLDNSHERFEKLSEILDRSHKRYDELVDSYHGIIKKIKIEIN